MFLNPTNLSLDPAVTLGNGKTTTFFEHSEHICTVVYCSSVRYMYTSKVVYICWRYALLVLTSEAAAALYFNHISEYDVLVEIYTRYRACILQRMIRYALTVVQVHTEARPTKAFAALRPTVQQHLVSTVQCSLIKVSRGTVLSYHDHLF